MRGSEKILNTEKLVSIAYFLKNVFWDNCVKFSVIVNQRNWFLKNVTMKMVEFTFIMSQNKNCALSQNIEAKN